MYEHMYAHTHTHKHIHIYINKHTNVPHRINFKKPGALAERLVKKLL